MCTSRPLVVKGRRRPCALRTGSQCQSAKWICARVRFCVSTLQKGVACAIRRFWTPYRPAVCGARHAPEPGRNSNRPDASASARPTAADGGVIGRGGYLGSQSGPVHETPPKGGPKMVRPGQGRWSAAAGAEGAGGNVLLQTVHDPRPVPGMTVPWVRSLTVSPPPLGVGPGASDGLWRVSAVERSGGWTPSSSGCLADRHTRPRQPPALWSPPAPHDFVIHPFPPPPPPHAFTTPNDAPSPRLYG